MKNDKDKKGVPVAVINLGTGKKTVSYYNLNNPPETPEYIKSIYNIKNSPIVKSIEYTKGTIEKFNIVSEALKPFTEWQKKISLSFENWRNINNRIRQLSNRDLLEWIKETQESGEDVKREFEKITKKKIPISNGKAREIMIKGETLKATNLVLGIVCFYAGFMRTEQVKGLFLDIGINPTDTQIKEVQSKRNKEQKQRKNKHIKRNLNRYYVSLEVSLQLMRALKITGKMRLRDRLKTVGELIGFR